MRTKTEVYSKIKFNVSNIVNLSNKKCLITMKAIMSFGKVLQSVIQHESMPDQQKQAFILKLTHHCGTQNPTYEEVSPVFEICLTTALENDSCKASVLSLFAFSTWGNKFPQFLREYLNIEQITKAFAENDPMKLAIIIMWLKEGLKILINDVDYTSTIGPILSGVLESKLVECGKNSTVLSYISEIYLLCPSFLPLQHMRLNFTITIMHCVASFPTPTKPETLKHMKNVGELVTMLWETLQLQDILSTLISMYSIISNTDASKEVCPAMAHILSLVFPQVVEGLGPRIVSDPQSSNEAFVATLTRLCKWLVSWPTAQTTLVHWIRTLVRLLHQSGRNIVPAKITYEQVPQLLEALRIPICRSGVFSVGSLLLMSFQYSPVPFHKVIPQLITVMECLENESSESAKSTLAGLAKLCHTQMALYPGHPETYQTLMDILHKYPMPSDEEIQNLIHEYSWVNSFRDGGSRYLNSSSKVIHRLLSGSSDHSPISYHKRSPSQRVGLRNLGNTCYMNSVIQALFMTDDFRHSVLHTLPKCNQQLLMKLQHLFTSLCFSHRSHISPRIFHDISRPSWFSPGMQHDCSEYLRHLMITLHEEERACQKLPEYRERMIIESETASLASDFQPLHEDSCQDPNKVDVELLEQLVPLEKPMTGIESTSEMKLELSTDMKDLNPLHVLSVNGKMKIKEEFEDQWKNEICEIPNNNIKELEMSKAKEISYLAEKLKSSSKFDSNVISYKRKHNVSPVASQIYCVKSPKGESSLTTEVDNSSDSGISGDLADEFDFSHSSSPLFSQKDVLPHDNKDILIQEVTVDNDYFVSLVHKAFGGKISTCIKCLNCKTESIHRDVFTDINLTFEDSDQNNASSAIRKQPERLCKQKPGEFHIDLKIEDMIANYLTSERLTGENQYECDRCASKQDAERSIQILETPEHLILTQLRFFYDISKGQRQKVFTNVDFGEELLLPISKFPSICADDMPCLSDTSKSVTPSSDEVPSPSDIKMEDIPESLPTCDRYALYGVVVHSGFSSEGGHYYCYARNSSIAGLPTAARERFGDIGEWYNFNDEKVTKTNFNNISQLTRTFTRDTTYLLFYRKVEVNEEVSSQVPILEDFSTLRDDLQEALENDNLQYKSEQDADFFRKRHTLKETISTKRNDDDEPPPPSGSCGDGGGFSMTSREVF